jgi:hypothetical protein
MQYEQQHKFLHIVGMCADSFSRQPVFASVHGDETVCECGGRWMHANHLSPHAQAQFRTEIVDRQCGVLLVHSTGT